MPSKLLGVSAVRDDPSFVLDLGRLQADAEHEGRRRVAGALILDEAGRVFVHRRGWDRRVLPGCWDIVGGHVEPGETLLEALEREIAEETGWRLTGTPELAYVADWETSEDGTVVRRREFDFVVEVDGDHAHPRLDHPQHVAFRWLGPGDLDILDENRGLDSGMVSHLVKLALRYRQARSSTCPHLTTFVDPAVAAPIETARVAWDPATATQIAAHITVAYPDEIASLDRLDRRLAEATAAVAPFRLRLGRVRSDEDADWVFAEVNDLDGGWAGLRELVLGSARARAVEPHVTLVHPRTTNRGPAAWAALAGSHFDLLFTVYEVALTAFDGRGWRAVERLALLP